MRASVRTCVLECNREVFYYPKARTKYSVMIFDLRVFIIDSVLVAYVPRRRRVKLLFQFPLSNLLSVFLGRFSCETMGKSIDSKNPHEGMSFN